MANCVRYFSLLDIFNGHFMYVTMFILFVCLLMVGFLCIHNVNKIQMITLSCVYINIDIPLDF
jgi:hypothetical protein